MNKARGFCLYKPDGSISRLVESESEMQSIFANVLEAFDNEQRKRFGEPPEDRNESTSPIDDATSVRSSDARSSSGNLSSTLTSAENSEPMQHCVDTISTSTAIPTRRSTRGSKSSDEQLSSLTYSYGSMGWDAIAMCWKPTTARKRKRGYKKAKSPPKVSEITPTNSHESSSTGLHGCNDRAGHLSGDKSSVDLVYKRRPSHNCHPPHQQEPTQQGDDSEQPNCSMDEEEEEATILQGQSGDSYIVTTQDKEGPPPNSDQPLPSIEEEDEVITEGTGNTPSYDDQQFHSMEEEEVNTLVTRGDKETTSPYFYLLMSLLEPCDFAEVDAKFWKTKRPIGFPGLRCSYCKGVWRTYGGKYFPRSVIRLEDTGAYQTHFYNCPDCPEVIKDQLTELKTQHKSRGMKREKKRIFFDKIWTRLHGNNIDRQLPSMEEDEVITDNDRNPPLNSDQPLPSVDEEVVAKTNEDPPANSDRPLPLVQEEATTIVTTEDKETAPPYFYLLMSLLEPYHYNFGDQGSSAHKRPIGFPGLRCRYCKGMGKGGKYFPRSVHNLGNLGSTILYIDKHFQRCPGCPKHIREELTELRTKHKSLPLRGMKKVFFDKIWTRLHGNNNYNLQEEVKSKTKQAPPTNSDQALALLQEESATIVTTEDKRTTPGHSDQPLLSA